MRLWLTTQSQRSWRLGCIWDRRKCGIDLGSRLTVQERKNRPKGKRHTGFMVRLSKCNSYSRSPGLWKYELVTRNMSWVQNKVQVSTSLSDLAPTGRSGMGI